MKNTGIALQPLDIVVVDGLWYMPHHPPIIWRGLDPAVHCLTLFTSEGDALSPEFTGIKYRNIDDYAGRRLTIHRYQGLVDHNRLISWLIRTRNKSQGYDFRQWVAGFVLGLTRKTWADNSALWTCAELPYWMFQENGYHITARDEVLPMPRLFRYSTAFETVFDGVWK